MSKFHDDLGAESESVMVGSGTQRQQVLPSATMSSQAILISRSGPQVCEPLVHRHGVYLPVNFW